MVSASLFDECDLGRIAALPEEQDIPGDGRLVDRVAVATQVGHPPDLAKGWAQAGASVSRAN
jgi:hypothetical protein